MRLPTVLVVALLLPIVTGESVRGAQVATLASQLDLSGATPLTLTGERRAAFEAYVADALVKFGVPGASVAVVQNGEVVYLNGFGVKELGGTEPITPDTLMAIGSITKSMTTMLAATLIDDGRLTWDTRLIDLLPDFAAGDPALTKSLTVHDAFCNCSGLPSRDLPLYFESGKLTPQWMVTALADVAPTTPFGKQFQYNNVLIAAGGYALGPAAGGGGDDVGLAYDTAMRERVLGPIGMQRSTFDLQTVLADGDYALPHAAGLAGELRPLSLITERFLAPVRPSGGLWSSAREMAGFLQTEMTGGVAPGGTRVVSTENLEATWAPGVAVPNLYGGPPEMAASMAHYGLGWESGEYRGLQIINHAGGTAGYTSEIAFLPQANLGIVILTNANALSPTHMPLAFEYAVQFRLVELLFDQPADLSAQIETTSSATPAPALGTLDPATVTPYLGPYANAELGEVTLSLRANRLILDAGELNSELRPRAADGSGPADYLFVEQPLASLTQLYGMSVSLTGGKDAPRLTITMPANVTGPEQTYIFKPVTVAEPAG
jgi:CubicO group peptidase (beta-lactamase class C family)